MTVKETVAAKCRWSEIWLPTVRYDRVVLDKSEYNYQGRVWLLCYDSYPTRFTLISYYYGSCSGCDPWEGATAKEVLAGLAEHLHVFTSKAALLAFLKKDDSNGSLLIDDDRRTLAEQVQLALERLKIE